MNPELHTQLQLARFRAEGGERPPGKEAGEIIKRMVNHLYEVQWMGLQLTRRLNGAVEPLGADSFESYVLQQFFTVTPLPGKDGAIGSKLQSGWSDYAWIAYSEATGERTRDIDGSPPKKNRMGAWAVFWAGGVESEHREQAKAAEADVIPYIAEHALKWDFHGLGSLAATKALSKYEREFDAHGARKARRPDRYPEWLMLSVALNVGSVFSKFAPNSSHQLARAAGRQNYHLMHCALSLPECAEKWNEWFEQVAQADAYNRGMRRAFDNMLTDFAARYDGKRFPGLTGARGDTGSDVAMLLRGMLFVRSDSGEKAIVPQVLSDFATYADSLIDMLQAAQKLMREYDTELAVAEACQWELAEEPPRMGVVIWEGE